MSDAIKAGDRVTVKDVAPNYYVYEVLYVGSNGMAALRREGDDKADLAAVNLLKPLPETKPCLFRNVYKGRSTRPFTWHYTREMADLYAANYTEDVRIGIEVWELVKVLEL